jgi:hypothetical protein
LFNFYYCHTVSFIFCFFIQVFSFNSWIEAKTSHNSNIEFSIDVDAIRNCNNLDDQIDNFINVGMQYQEATSKNFKYNKFLKQSYKHLEKEGIYLDKKTKEDLKKRIQDRISERFFEHKKKTVFCAVDASSGQTSSKNPNGDYSNDFREGIVEVGIGCIGIAYGSPSVKATGVVLVGDGTIKIVRGTVNYIWPESNERDHYKERERSSRDGLAERERDKPVNSR